MTDRERWIVYPLLFMTLALSLRDRLTNTVDADQIHCRTIVLRDAQGQSLLYLAPESLARTLPAGREGLMLLDAERRHVATVGAVARFDAVVAEEVAARKGVVGEVLQTQAVVVVDHQQKPLVSVGVEFKTPNKESDRISPIKMFDAQGQVSAQFGPLTSCRELHIVDQARQSRVALGTVALQKEGSPLASVGRISVLGAGGDQAIGLSTDPAGENGVVSTYGPNRTPLVVLASNPWGGVVRVMDREQTFALDLGHFGLDRLSGLLAENASGQVSNLINSLIKRPEPPAPAAAPDVDLGPGPPEPEDKIE